MSLVELVGRYAADGRAVAYLPEARPLTGRMSSPSVVPEGQPAPARAVVVGVGAAGAEVAGVRGLGEVLGEQCIGVLALAAPADELPLGAVLAALGEQGLRVVAVETGAPVAARTVLVLTRDRSVSQASYLLGQEVPEDRATGDRRANEWLVEGLVCRARLTTLEEQVGMLRTQLDTVTRERDALRDSRRR